MRKETLLKFHGASDEVDVVIESTGFFADKEKARHILKQVQKK